MSKKPYSILLIATQQIGDVLLATPLLRSLRVAYPAATIDILVYKGKSGILEGNTDYNNVIESDDHPNITGYWVLLKRIFRKYDLAVNTQANDRAYQYAFIAAKKRVGMISSLKRKSLWKRAICTDWRLLDDTNTHTILQNLELAECLNINKEYQVTVPNNAAAEGELNKIITFDWKNDRFVVLHLLPMWRYKRWTDNGWEALAEYLISQNIMIVLSGGSAPEEVNYCEKFSNRFPSHVVSVAGKVSFGILSKLLSHASAYIGPDTATTHLAAACGTPTIALYGPTNPIKWGPWPKGYAINKSPWLKSAPYQQVGNVSMLQGLGECVPCHRAGCDNHNNSESRCMNELPAYRVIAVLKTVLSN